MRHAWADRLASVFVEWTGSTAEDESGYAEMERRVCSELYRLRWRECLIVGVARKMICHLHAPDAESVRVALRQARIEVDAVWAGTVHDVDELAAADVAVERRFPTQLPANVEKTLAWLQREWLKPSQLRLVRAIVPNSRDRVICLCAAPDPDNERYSRVAGAGVGYDWVRSVNLASSGAR